MKGVVVYCDGRIKVEELPKPKINDYQALVENLSCGICNGTDLKIIHGRFKGFNTYPAVLGHETVGRVVEVGRKVISFKVGDLVLRSILEKVEDPRYYSGWGGFAEYGVVGDWRAMEKDGRTEYPEIYYAQQVIPGNLDPHQATMLITLKEVASGLNRFGVGKNDAVLIHGAGPVGLSMVRLAKLRGAGPIVVSEPDAGRRERAERLGADVVLNPTEVDVVAEARKIVPQGFDYVIDAVGINALITQSLKIVKFNGKVGVYGIAPETRAEIDWTEAPYNFVIHFVQWPTFRDEAAVHRQILALVEAGAIDLGEFVTHVIPRLEDFQKGLDLITSKQAIKVAVNIKG
jgi:threonine dehydrogenase-like Zn-dependent dehydrogenase|uniref:Sorbitol dehydrogenase n=1 Tax=Candidatus Methanosuratincola petrocarbonis (ex Vanwonterghem et al. 2016) TaxID=1867261 RepID=A0A7J3V0Q1_9CREN